MSGRVRCEVKCPGYVPGMPSSITRVTSLDHDRMHRLLRRATAAGPSQQRWRDELVHLVRAHLRAERAALTPAVVGLAGQAAAASATDLDGLEAELESACAAMAADQAEGNALLRSGEQLAQTLTVHADLLREQILHPLEAAVPRKEMRRLGGVYVDTRDRALRDDGVAPAPPRNLDRSRAELYEMARKAGIEGRSSMSRADLIAELQRRRQVR